MHSSIGRHSAPALQNRGNCINVVRMDVEALPEGALPKETIDKNIQHMNSLYKTITDATWGKIAAADGWSDGVNHSS